MRRAKTQADGSGAFRDDAYSLTFRAYHGPFRRITEDEPCTLDVWESCDLLPVAEDEPGATMLGWFAPARCDCGAIRIVDRA